MSECCLLTKTSLYITLSVLHVVSFTTIVSPLIGVITINFPLMKQSTIDHKSQLSMQIFLLEDLLESCESMGS